MDTFRKWLNKPKADDKSLLARFYHADRSLTAVTSELDSFDGRAEPDRCSRLVSRLRQGQDKVLAITNLIMEELLGEDRDPRAFRAKFPEEVLQENLAGQLWFGAECLAAGSSIMNREQESKEMRPLAQAVTRSLGNVRNLLRDQCLRNNVPNSKTLHLDVNDSSTEQLYESLKIFDRLFAEFELRYVSAMVPVKTKHEYEMQELISVLFSETLQRALKIGLLDQEKVDAFDPALMFSIPRLAIVSGLVIYPDGPLDMNMPSDELSEMFRPFRTILIKIRDLLNALDKNELFQLEKLLCTNEDINTTVPVGTSSIEAPCPEQQGTTTTTTTTTTAVDSTNKSSCDDANDESNSTTQVAVTSSLSKVLKHHRHHQHQQQSTRFNAKIRSPSISSSVSANSSLPSTPSLSPTPSPTPSNSLVSTASSANATSTTSAADFSDNEEDIASDDEYDDVDDEDVIGDDEDADAEASATAVSMHDEENADIVAADCATGYLIPNTNFGNLLQPQEVALNGNFVASEDELTGNQEDNLEDEDVPTSSSRLRRLHQQTINDNNNSNSDIPSNNNNNSEQLNSTSKTETTAAENENEKTVSNCRHHHHHHHRRNRHHHHHHHHHHHNSQPHQHSKLKRCYQGGGSGSAGGGSSSSAATLTNEPCSNIDCITKKSPVGGSSTQQHHDTSSVDSHTSTTSSASSSSASSPTSLSAVVGAATKDATLVAWHTANRRLKFKSTESLLHRLFVCIAGVADQLQTNFASDLRQILRAVFLMNMSIMEDDEIDIPEKTKESELFEFRASENDVIQESSNGSNQSIYSAEEVNPELDNVFNNSGNHSNHNINNSRSCSLSSNEGNTTNNHNNNHATIRHSTGSAGAQRIGTTTIDLGTNDNQTNLMRNHVERSRSLGDHEQQQQQQDHNSHNSNNNSRNLSAYISGRRMSMTTAASAAATQSNNNIVGNAMATTQTTSPATRHQQQRNRHNSVGSNSPGSSSSSSSSSESNSPISERANGSTLASNTATTTTATTRNNIHNNNHNNNNNSSNAPSTTSASCLAPPAWIPDDKAPRCMSCHTQFTAFRRRHHCRNCGGVFCSVCSNASAPLPKYGLTKAVRVCRECYVREVRGAANASLRSGNNGNNAPTHLAATATHRQTVNTATAGGS